MNLKPLKLPLIMLCGLALLVAIAPTAQAQSFLPACVSEGYCTLCDIMQLAINFGKFLLGIVGSLALLMFVYGGFMWLTSGGEASRIDAGKKILVNSVIGVGITFFAWVVVAFVVSTLTAGSSFKWDIKLTCAPLPGLEPIDVENRDTPVAGEAKCKNDMETVCGIPYTGAINEPCIGKKCEPVTVAGKTQVCLQSGTTWACGNCLANNTICTTDRDCCEGSCGADKKCTSSAVTGEILGKHCNATDKKCPPPFVCQTNWSNRCTYGKAGSSCYSNAECKSDSFCMTTQLNVCSSRSPWAICEQGKIGQCPSGYTCTIPVRYCAVGENGCTTTSENRPTTANTSFVCMPNAFIKTITCSTHEQCPSGYCPNTNSCSNTCVCDCDNDTMQSDCGTASYNGQPAPFCNTKGYNFCTPGLYASPCDEQNECVSGRCNHWNSNICTQGDVGEGCAGDTECRPENKCFAHICVPDAFTPPTPPTDTANPEIMN